MNQKSQSLARSWVVVMTAGAFFFFNFIQMSLFGSPAMKAYFTERLSISDPAVFGNFGATFLYACVICLIPAGVLLDKLSVKKLILTMLALVTLCVFSLTYVTNLYLAMVLRALTGAAHCIAFMAPLRLAPRWFPSRWLALAMGVLVAFAVFGGWVAGTPMQLAVDKFGGHTTMLLNGLLGVVVLGLVALLVRDYPETQSQPNDRPSHAGALPPAEGLKLAIANPQNWLAGIYIGLLNLSVLVLAAMWGSGYVLAINPDLSDDPESSEAVATAIVGMVFIGTMIGSPLCGWVSDQFRTRKWSMFTGALLSLLTMLLIMFIPSPGAGLLYTLFLALGIITASQSIGYPVVAESNEERVLGSANGFSAMLLMGMAAIGQPLFGVLLKFFGGATPEGYRRAVYLMPISFLIALGCTLLLRETFGKRA